MADTAPAPAPSVRPVATAEDVVPRRLAVAHASATVAWLAWALAAVYWEQTSQLMLEALAAVGLLLGATWTAQWATRRIPRRVSSHRAGSTVFPASALVVATLVIANDPDVLKKIPLVNRVHWARILGNTATKPVPRAAAQHRRCLREAQHAGDVDLVWLGDSITAHWADEGRPVWTREYGGLRGLNLGVGGDRIQNILWRIEHGELQGVRARCVVIEAGTNNISRNTTDEVVAGLGVLINTVRRLLPDAKILVTGIFPRGEHLNDPINRKIHEINARLPSLEQGDRVRVRIVDDRLADARGGLRETIPGGVHLSRKGYEVWASALRPVLEDLLDPVPYQPTGPDFRGHP